METGASAESSEKFPDRLARTAAQIEQTLGSLLGPDTTPGEIARPERVLAAMRYACLGGGKRIRPFLTVETARMFGVEDSAVLRVAASVEFVHCYSLVHDDLPAMDDDDLRRGRPTVHKAFDEATAILAGDGLLTFAFDVLSDPETHPDAAVRADLVCSLARAAGIGGMVGGQALDLAAEGAQAPLDQLAIRQLQAMKTGAILLVSIKMGAIVARVTGDQWRMLERYGRAIGAAFQIADDLLDETGTEADVGKRIGKDADRNKATLVRCLGIDGARELCDQLVETALSSLSSFGREADGLRDLARFIVARSA